MCAVTHPAAPPAPGASSTTTLHANSFTAAARPDWLILSIETFVRHYCTFRAAGRICNDACSYIRSRGFVGLCTPHSTPLGGMQHKDLAYWCSFLIVTAYKKSTGGDCLNSQGHFHDNKLTAYGEWVCKFMTNALLPPDPPLLVNLQLAI